MIVRGPASISRLSPSMIVRPAALNDTSSSASGSTASTVTPLRGGLDELRAGIDPEHERDEDDAQAKRERQVALARLQRDGGRHDTGDAGDVAPDDHHRADFSRGAAEAREHDGHERKARVP